MKRLIVALCLLSAACASGAGYGPASRPGGAGFSETRIENDRYRVSFNGAGSPEAAMDFALLRAAELTLQNGYDWFIVDQRFVDGGNAAPVRPRVSIGVGAGNYGGGTSVGVGVGTGIGLGGSSAPSNASLEVRLGRGTKPGGVNVYDARDVQASIRARVPR